ncbi:MAG: tetratricopeptide repeat protein [Bacteroidetes bacterium]|nr:MAG: tetratricopeptide repeat protein [Bacteroidota bacterium]
MRNALPFIIAAISIFSGFSGAQAQLEDSIRLTLRSDQHDTIKFDRLINYIFNYSNVQPEVALIYSDTAIKLATELQDSTRLALAFNRKGLSYYYLGDYNRALENYFTAISIKENIGEYATLDREYNNIGLTLRNLEQNSEALEYFKSALEILEKHPNRLHEALVWNNIGISKRGMSDYDAALAALEKALSINLEINAIQSQAHNLNNIGNIFYDQNEPQKAIEYYNKALQINKEINNRYEKAQNLHNLGRAFLYLNRFESTIAYLNRAEEIIREINAVQLLLTNHNLKADYFQETMDYERSLTYRNLYSELRDSIYFSNRTEQFEMLRRIANTEKEMQRMEFLEQINAIQQERINAQYTIQVGGLFVIALILFMLFILFRNNKIIKKLNSSLLNHANEVENLNNSLQTANEELNTKAESLNDALINLQNTQNQLIQSEKMASLGVLAAGIAHELNNPLNFIKGGAAALESHIGDNFEPDTDISKLVEAINEGVTRASRIVSGLNLYSRKNDQVFEESDLHKVIENCLLIIRNQTKHKVCIQRIYTDEPLNFKCNEGKIHQAILNLLMNAVQAIEEKGTITIQTTLTEQSLHISITDTGSGISQENMPKILDPFFTTRELGKGTGLGLFITHSIIEEHKGKMEFESEPGRGTRIHIIFPIK